MATIRLTAAQAMVRFLGRQETEVDGARLPLPQIGRQAAPAWTCLERLQPHQSLNPM